MAFESKIGEHIYATRRQYNESAIGKSGASVLAQKHTEINAEVHKQKLNEKCKALETQLNNLFFGKRNVDDSGNSTENERFYRLLDEAIANKYPTALVDRTTLSISKDLTVLNQELRDAATNLNTSISKSQGFIRWSRLEKQLSILQQLVNDLATNNGDIQQQFKAIQLEMQAISTVIIQQGNSGKALSFSNSSNTSKALTSEIKKLLQEQSKEIIKIGNDFARAATTYEKVKTLEQQIADLKKALIGFDNKGAVGDVLEYSLLIAGAMAAGKCDEAILEMIEAGTEGSQRALSGFYAKSAAEGITFTINNDNFRSTNKLATSSFSGGNDKFYATMRTGTQNKIDVFMTFEDTELNVSAKNYNLNNLMYNMKGLMPAQDKSSLYQYLQNENDNYFVDHFINLTMAQPESQYYFKNHQEPNATANLIVQKIVFWKALTGENFLKQFADNIRGMDGANVFIFNNNQTGKITVTPMSEIFDNVFSNISLLSITDFPITTSYWDANSYPTHPAKGCSDEIDYLDPINRLAFASKVVSYLANLKLLVKWHVSAAGVT